MPVRAAPHQDHCDSGSRIGNGTQHTDHRGLLHAAVADDGRQPEADHVLAQYQTEVHGAEQPDLGVEQTVAQAMALFLRCLTVDGRLHALALFRRQPVSISDSVAQQEEHRSPQRHCG
ncbi:hypothetical protein D3C71_1694360 [compost metagenome]